MTAVVARELVAAVRVVVGIDTHRDEHVAVAIEQQVCVSPGVAPQRPVTYPGSWRGGSERRATFAPSGPSSLVPGGTLARLLAGRGFTFVEVNRLD